MARRGQKIIAVRCELRSLFGWLVICCFGAALIGCGPIIGQFTGKRSATVEVEAKYKLQSSNLLILLDTPAGVARSDEARAVLSNKLEREIRHYELVESIIPASELSAWRSSRNDFEELAIEQIGRELWAQQVLYVEIIEFQLGTMMDKSAGQGLMRGRVKVFDVSKNQRAWPKTEPLGHDVMVRMGLGAAEEKNSQQDLTEAMCQRMAVKVIKLFRDHKEPRPSAQTK